MGLLGRDVATPSKFNFLCVKVKMLAARKSGDRDSPPPSRCYVPAYHYSFKICKIIKHMTMQFKTNKKKNMRV